MTAIYTPLEIDEARALVNLALKERRTPRAQAAYLLRKQLESLGLLQPTPTIPTAQEVKQNERQPA